MRYSRKETDIDKVISYMTDGDENFIVYKCLDFLKNNNEKYTCDTINNRYYISSYFPSFPSRAWDRFFSASNKIANGHRVPLQADVAVTGRCHCDCIHCFRGQCNNQDLQLNIIKTFIEDLYDLGGATLGITGGEPMLRKDILEIIKLIPEGMEGILYTTGHGITDSFIEKINKTNLTKIIISLDHYREDKVALIRNYRSAFKEATEALQLLSKYNIYTAVTLMITEDFLNENEIIKYIEFVNNLGVDEVRLTLPIPQGKLAGKDFKRLYFNGIKVAKNIKNRLCKEKDLPTIMLFSEYESHKYFGCGAGTHYISLNNDGSINPCVSVPLSFGNVYESSFKDIYRDMHKYFRCSCKTCLGKKVSKALIEEKLSNRIELLDKKTSTLLKRKVVTDDGIASFFSVIK